MKTFGAEVVIPVDPVDALGDPVFADLPDAKETTHA